MTEGRSGARLQQEFSSGKGLLDEEGERLVDAVQGPSPLGAVFGSRGQDGLPRCTCRGTRYFYLL